MSSIITVFRSTTEWRTLLCVLLAAGWHVAPAAEPDAAAPLSLYEYGDYAVLSTRPNPEDHVIVFIPSLVSVLLAAEQGGGEPLTEPEVLALRDRAAVMAVPAGSAARLAAGRGYPDLDPGRCWEEWQAQRRHYFNP